MKFKVTAILFAGIMQILSILDAFFRIFDAEHSYRHK